MKNTYLLLFCLLFAPTAFSQNLLVNPSAESGDPASIGWTSVSMGSTGASCYNNSGWRITGNQNGFPAAKQGTYFFYAGCSAATGSTFELRQDINVTSNASLIDLGWDAFTFSGYMQSFTQSPPDQAEMIVEYRDKTNTAVLTTYSTGLTANQGTWTFYSNTTTAPAGTRFIRVRLLTKLNTGPSIDGYFDEMTLSTSIPLAVVLASFSIEPANTSVKLVWTTSAENNNRFFTVQRSQNSTDWSDIEKLPGSNNSDSGMKYIAYDNRPLTGISYYRLQITDKDGKESYSEIKEIDFTGGFADLTIFPNPAKTFFTIGASDLKNAEVSVFNNIGQRVNISQTAQNNAIRFDAAGLPPGIYFIRISSSQNTEVRKILIE